MARNAQMPESVKQMLAELQADDRSAGRAPSPPAKRKAS